MTSQDQQMGQHMNTLGFGPGQTTPVIPEIAPSKGDPQDALRTPDHGAQRTVGLQQTGVGTR